MASAMAPAGWVYVWTVIIHPVVVVVQPAVKMYKQLAWADVGNSHHTYQQGIAPVHSLQLHSDFKAMWRMLQTQFSQTDSTILRIMV